MLLVVTGEVVVRVCVVCVVGFSELEVVAAIGEVR